MDLGSWLRNLGLGRYEPVFVENAIDSDVLPELTESDLDKLGIPIGDRKRLIKAIRATFPESQDQPGSRTRAPSPSNRLAAAERRHLTVMICDLVGSTALSTQLDPEDLRAVMDAYHAACARITRTYDGFLAQFQGDGILAYFGYPRAHEDDAERTVRAGLEIIAAVAQLETPFGQPLAVRIGIATGLVVVGDISDAGSLRDEGVLREHAVVGDTPNLAARIQGLAEPGTIVVAASTRRLLGDLFHLRDIGRHAVKGIAEPVAAWVVEGLSASVSRFEAIHVASLPDLVGRQYEIDFLMQRQALAWKGEGQVVLIAGEPGIGKSRLAAALAERVAGEPHIRMTMQGSPYHTNSALRPFIAQLEQAARFKTDDTVEERLDKLEAVLAKGSSEVQSVAPLFASLLSLPAGERYEPLTLSPTEQRRLTLAALLDQLEGLASRQPILFVFEDVHWADATSLELIDLAIARVRSLPILALFTFRPDFRPPWIGLPNVGSVTLGRLDRDDVASMVARVTGGRVLPAEVMKGIVAKTDGNPLFVEELTKAVLESGILLEDAGGDYRLDGPLKPLAIPATLQDSLMARLDRLAPMKEISQSGAAIGREFSYLLLRAVVGGRDTSLLSALAQLEQAELVFRRGDPPEAIYTFKHALVRDAAYESLLKTSRQQLHRRIARALEDGFADVVASEPETLAHHFTEAGLIDQAVDYWLKAGNLALSRSANAEAVKHLSQGMELTQSQQPSPQQIRNELDFCLALGPAMAATQGYAAPATLKVFSHARDLLGEGGTLSEQMTVLWGTFLAHGMRAEHAASLDVARQCMALAARHEHPGMSALANRFMGQTLTFMGEFGDARRHLERTIALCAVNEGTIAAFRRFGIDDQVGAMFSLSRALLLLGYPDQSAAEAQRSVARARALGLPFTIALALSQEVLTGILSGDPRRATAHVDDTIAYCVKHGHLQPELKARFTKGALLVQDGEPANGFEMMRAAMTADRNAVQGHNTQYLPLYLGYIADAHARLGEPALGLDLLAEAIGVVEATDERFFEAELYRFRGEMLLAVGKKADAETALRRALTIAREQQARWWELRAAVTLARHLHAEGRSREAYAVLQPVYGWFTEGFRTPVLKEAEILLDELRHPSGQQATAQQASANNSGFGAKAF
jgi:class 3 adenylate cyclase/tetratricopeptide (TPR) repeat protein/ABC-type transport system involved in cytochrome c biogenesis ATPase subunit